MPYLPVVNTFLQAVASRHDILIFLMAHMMKSSYYGASSGSWPLPRLLDTHCGVGVMDAEGVILVMPHIITCHYVRYVKKQIAVAE